VKGYVVGDHAMIKDGDRFKMWHVGITYPQRGYRNEFGYAESKDGIHWRKCRLNPILTQGKPGTWDGGWIYAAGIVKIDDEQSDTHVYAGKSGASYHLFYTGQPTNNECICGVKRIGYAFSLDGIHWVKWKNPVTTEPPFQDSAPALSWPKYGQTRRTRKNRREDSGFTRATINIRTRFTTTRRIDVTTAPKTFWAITLEKSMPMPMPVTMAFTKRTMR